MGRWKKLETYYFEEVLSLPMKPVSAIWKGNWTSCTSVWQSVEQPLVTVRTTTKSLRKLNIKDAQVKL